MFIFFLFKFYNNNSYTVLYYTVQNTVHYKAGIMHQYKKKKKILFMSGKAPSQYKWLEALKNKTTREHRRCEIEEAFTV